MPVFFRCDHVKGCLKVLHSTSEAFTKHDHVEGSRNVHFLSVDRLCLYSNGT